MENKEKEKVSPFFQSGWNGRIPVILAVSIAFHLIVIGVLVAFDQIRFEREPEPVKVFELVQVQKPQRVAPKRVRRTPPKPPEEKPAPKKEEPRPKPKPEVKKELPPEPKIAKEEPPAPKEEPVETVPEEPVEADDAMDLPDDMDLPEGIVEESGLNPVGYVDMDPLMQVYLERLKQIIMQNFNPPSGLHVAKTTKTSVQFTVDRFGTITDISLKRSSGNKTWDHLSVRAVKVSKLPELPPNYRAPALSLNFNFTPN